MSDPRRMAQHAVAGASMCIKVLDVCVQPEPKEEVVEEEEEEEAAAAPEPGEDDEEADAYGGYKEDGEQGGGAGGEGGEGEEGEEDDGMPDSPTHSYRPGGLGVGSHFFNADDLK